MNDNAPFQRSKSSSVEDVARRWFAHRRSEGSSDSQADFKAWLDAAPDHAAAYRQVEQDFAQAEILKASSLYGIGRPQPSPPFRHHRGWIAGVSAVAATLILVLFQHGASKMHEPSPVPSQSTVSLATRHGEIRTERLSDGSQVTLDTDSRLELDINGHERRIRLARGHIRLSIAKDARPFRVDAGAGVITAPMASEASFDIGYDDTQYVRMTMITGSAEARPFTDCQLVCAGHQP
jgi:transmembrane sensor